MNDSEKTEKLLTVINQLEDEGRGPHVMIINGGGVMFPPHLAKQESVLFNISSGSIGTLNLDKDGISFNARFSGAEHTIYAPLAAIAYVQSKDGKFRLANFAEPKLRKQVTFKPSFWDFTPRAHHLPSEAEDSPPAPAKIDPPPVKKKPEFQVYIGAGLGDGQPKGKLQLVST